MASSYKLEEETPNTFISPIYLGNRFVYRMIRFAAELDYNFIRDIDLRKDTLSVHGTEIKEPMLQNLYDCLRLRPSVGRVYVNCNGACYIVVEGKGVYRPFDNAIFDWSRFGVIVPNSVNDVFRKQLQEKDQELESSKEDAKKRVTELEEQLFRRFKECEDLKTKVQIVHEQLSSYKKVNENRVNELQKLQYEVSSSKIELQLTKNKLDSSYKRIEQLEEELSACKSEIEAKEVELRSMKMDEMQCIKILLEFTEKEVKNTTSYLGECCVIKSIEIVDDVIVN